MSDLEYSKIKSAIEALIFVSGEGLTIKEIANGLDEDLPKVETVLNSLVDEYLERDCGIMISETAGKYKFSTSSGVFEIIRSFIHNKKKHTLTKAMLETLAIITYKQPITLYEIEEIRGVSSRSLVTGLANKKLIKIAGYKEAPGKPGYYATTKEFLEYFGLNNLQDLPSPKEVKELNFEDL
ncbi:MAG: SMC-Scp complex subunit ScpB [Spirochaetia bacterium]|nr:SMC-Scp complex subunit ScpB [Spirochaetia bacterium]